MAMVSATTPLPLIDRLPEVRGRYSVDSPLSRVTWFRVGGPAEVLFKPADLEDLQQFLSEKPQDVPVTVIGVASNLLVRDGGVDGVVIRLGGAFSDISVDGMRVTAGAAALDLTVAKTAAAHDIAGLEFLSGIPGSIGGALRMNAGAYGSETKDVLKRAWAVSGSGELREFTPDELDYGYRHCGLGEGWTFVRGEFEGQPGNGGAIRARMAEIQTARAESQPIRSRTGGSTFKNPEGHKSWQLIDAAGCRGLLQGKAQVSTQHCNFLINTGDASAKDLETLGEEVRRRVKADSGVELHWEIKRIGRPA